MSMFKLNADMIFQRYTRPCGQATLLFEKMESTYGTSSFANVRHLVPSDKTCTSMQVPGNNPLRYSRYRRSPVSCRACNRCSRSRYQLIRPTGKLATDYSGNSGNDRSGGSTLVHICSMVSQTNVGVVSVSQVYSSHECSTYTEQRSDVGSY